jgi:uncharacterized LabA/DUF88 family protein
MHSTKVSVGESIPSADLSPVRVFAYIDGFNLYYGLRNACRLADADHIRNGGSPATCVGRSLYWLDIHRVILSQVRAAERCDSIRYFTAPRSVPKRVRLKPGALAAILASNDRQRVFLEAIGTLPLVSVVPGRYSEKPPHWCEVCGHTSAKWEEKGTDVNIATEMVCDAYENRYDLALVMSADADLATPIRVVQGLGKRVRLLLPPGRKRAKELKSVAREIRELKIKAIRGLTMPEVIGRTDALPPIVRPQHWAAPGAWVWGKPKRRWGLMRSLRWLGDWTR